MSVVTSFNDEPTLTDSLGRIDLVRSIGEEIADCKAPQVFGVHGDWGSGKSTFLHLIHLYLAGKCPESQEYEDVSQSRLVAQWRGWKEKKEITVIWFEAWRYQYESNPIVALLQEIRMQMQYTLAGISNKARKIAEVATYGALASLEDLTKRLGVSPSKVQEAGEKWEREHYAVQLPTHVIRKLLEEAIKQLLGKKKKLVILIDDLDRCEGECVYRLLEGIKIYLNIPNCVFVLGMDQQIVELAVAKHIHTDVEEKSRLLVREYVEKICRNVWHLPLVTDPSILLSTVLGNLPGKDAVGAVVRAYKCLPANPRKIKAFAQIIERFMRHLEYPYKDARPEDFREMPKDFKAVSSESGPKESLDPIAGWIVVMAGLYLFHPEIYRVIEGHPRYYYKVLDWANGKDTDDARLTNIQLPNKKMRDEKASTPGSQPSESIYADPMRGFIFRIQPLVIDLGPEIPEAAIRRSLLGCIQ